MIVCFYVVQNACVGVLGSFWRPCSGVRCSPWMLLEAPWRSPKELEQLLAASSVLMTTQKEIPELLRTKVGAQSHKVVSSTGILLVGGRWAETTGWTS